MPPVYLYAHGRLDVSFLWDSRFSMPADNAIGVKAFGLFLLVLNIVPSF